MATEQGQDVTLQVSEGQDNTQTSSGHGSGGVGQSGRAVPRSLAPWPGSTASFG